MTDTERLDWLQEHKVTLSEFMDKWNVQLHHGNRDAEGVAFYVWKAPTVRDVIDKAAAALPPAQPEPTVEPKPEGGSK